MQGKERLKKEAGHSKLVGNKQGNLQTGLVLGSEMSRFLHLLVRILKDHIETLTRLRFAGGKQSIHSKSRGESEEPLTARSIHESTNGYDLSSTSTKREEAG